MRAFSARARQQAQLGDIQNGVGFRRTRLQAIGKLTEFTGYTHRNGFCHGRAPQLHGRVG